MKATCATRKNCRLCGSKKLDLALKLKPTPIGDAYVSSGRAGKVQKTYPLDLFLCRDCGHAQILTVVDPELLFGDYLFETSSSGGLVAQFAEFVETLSVQKRLREGDLAVDIGSNDGTLLKFFKQKGMEVLGIDPAANIARKAAKAGIKTLPEFFTRELAGKIRARAGPAGIITANNVFAHIDDLGGVTEGVRCLLAPGGVFIFEVSYLVDIVERMLFDTIYHEHLSYHSVKPLKTFFDLHMLELFEIDHIKSKGGSIRCFVQHKGGPNKVSPVISRMIASEVRAGYDRLGRFAGLAARINGLKIKLHKILDEAARKGQAVAGYGASVTVTTLIYQLELGRKLSFLCDDNKKRYGLLSPGFHIPIVSPDEMYRKKTDFVIILAWNYAQQIMQKHQEFLRGGGHFVLPAPEVRVI